MKTIFALYRDYPQAHEAFTLLLEKGFEEKELNALAQVDVAKNDIDANLHEVQIAATGQQGEKTRRDLGQYLLRQQPDTIPDLGKVYAAGEMASMLASTASGMQTELSGFTGSLLDFGLGEETALAYRDGVAGGGYLLMVRTDDNRASLASNALRERKGEKVQSYP